MDSWLSKANPSLKPPPVKASTSSTSPVEDAPTSRNKGPLPKVHVAAKKREIDPTSMPWVEKYRPKTIADVSAQEHTINVLTKTLKSANLPHMLFYGPPGTGKTSTILALAKQLFGPELFRTRVLELNASDERGISVVREKIKSFAKIAISPANSEYPCPPYKIVILDEADSMTQDAQSALRRIMETYSKITRFVLICNYVTRIIEPIVSRCSKFRFKPLDQSNTTNRLQSICEAEKVQYDDDALPALIAAADGDLRRAITYLQSASRLHAGERVSARSVQEIAGVVPEKEMTALTLALGVSEGGGKAGPTPSFDKVQKAVERVVREGFSATQLLSQLHDVLIMDPALSARAKAGIATALGEADKCLTDGADEELQLLNACLKIRHSISTG